MNNGRDADNCAEGVVQAGRGAVATFGVLTASIGFLLGINSVAKHRDPADSSRMAAAEIREVVSAHPGEKVVMGYGGDAGYKLTWLRTELPFQSGLVLDAAALMDMQESGLTLPRATLDGLRSGVVKHWLVPRGEAPFTVTDYYHGRPLFSDEFRQIFADHYQLAESLTSYDMWNYKAAADVDELEKQSKDSR